MRKVLSGVIVLKFLMSHTQPNSNDNDNFASQSSSVMKKNLITFSIILFVFLWITSCKVVNDLNASNEDVTTTLQNFPASIHYFDETSQAPFDLSFGYSCNGNSDISSQTAQGNRTTNTSKTSKRLKPTLSIGRSIKEQLQELRKEYAK